MSFRLITPGLKADSDTTEKSTVFGNRGTPESNKKSNQYLDAIRAYIPIEITGAYIALLNIYSKDTSFFTLLFVLLGLTLLAPIYTYVRVRMENSENASFPIVQCVITTILFLVWSYGIGGIWLYLGVHDKDFAFAIVLFATLTLPLIGQDSNGRPVLYMFDK